MVFIIPIYGAYSLHALCCAVWFSSIAHRGNKLRCRTAEASFIPMWPV